jgi:hypothetical protein
MIEHGSDTDRDASPAHDAIGRRQRSISNRDRGDDSVTDDEDDVPNWRSRGAPQRRVQHATAASTGTGSAAASGGARVGMTFRDHAAMALDFIRSRTFLMNIRELRVFHQHRILN